MRFLCFIVLVATALTSGRAAESHSTNTALAADLKKFKLAPGLKAELAAAEPLLQNPVAFSIDGRGHYFIAESHRWATSVFDITQNTPWLLDDLSFRTVNDRAAFLARQFATNFAVLTNDSELIRLVEDRDGDGIAESSSVFADGFRESTSGTASGVLAQGTNVWFTSIPDLWRFTTDDLRITNRSDRQGSPSSSPPVNRLATGLGVHISVSGHDVHGLIRGHDGRIYFSFGDRGVCVTNRESAVLNVPDTGGVLRCEPDGRNLEIFCTGLRNPQELAFDDYGNLWTVDNDTAGADPCRVLHLVEGGDYGWRASYQHMKSFGPWVSEEMWRGGLDGILPPAGTVSQGPAGLAFYPGTGLTPQLAGKFVHADFPGGIWAYSVKPRGASFELGEKEKILWNCWPTDVDFGPDGALYVLDWVESWVRSGKGRIYRLTSNGELGVRNVEQVAEVKRLLGEGMAKRSAKELLALLGHVDRRVRLEAQWELAGRSKAGGWDESFHRQFVEATLESPSEFQRLHCVWLIAQVWREGLAQNRDASAWVHRIAPALEDESMAVAGNAALVLSEVGFLRFGEHFSEMAKSSSPVMASFGVRALARLGDLRKSIRLDPPMTLRRVSSKMPTWLGGRVFNWSVERIQEFDTPSGMGMETVLRVSESADPILREAAAQWIAARVRASRVPAGYEWQPAVWTFAASTNPGSRIAAAQGLRMVTSPAITNLLSDADPGVAMAVARAINDTPIPAGNPALARLIYDSRFRDANWGWSALSNITPAGPFSATVRPPRDQVLLRSLNANFRVGEAKNAEALVRFAVGAPASSTARTFVSTEPAVPEAGAPMSPSLRAEALFLLGAWEVLPAKVGDLPIKPTKDPNHGAVPTVNPENWPGWFDRVVGLYRPLPPRPPTDARRALAPHINVLLSDKEPVVAQAALDAAVKLRLTNAAPTLLVLMRSTNTSAGLRKQIPGALAALGAEELGEATKLALAESDPAIRAAALPHLGRLRSSEAVRILSEIVTAAIGAPVFGGDERLAQAAFAALGELASAEADVVLRSAMKRLVDGGLNPAFELELVEAATRRSDPEIKSMIESFETARAKDSVLGSWRSVLSGGDAERGKAIFFDKVEVQCSRCHAVKGQGGIVGPKLDGVGKLRSREYLLESIVFPNRSIAAGFENVMLKLKNGAEHFGLVKGEDDKELRLESPEDGPLKIAKADIVTRQRGLSAMPEGFGQALSKREVRDLVEYLSGLK